jgi:hypothetical protein
MQSSNECPRDGPQSSLQQAEPQHAGRPKVLLVVGDGAEVMDTLYPFFRLGESYRVVVAVGVSGSGPPFKHATNKDGRSFSFCVWQSHRIFDLAFPFPPQAPREWPANDE